MENELINNFFAMVNQAVENGTDISVTMRTRKNSIAITFTPSYMDNANGIYVESVNDDIIKIKQIDEIFYDAMEGMYFIKSDGVDWYINFI